MSGTSGVRQHAEVSVHLRQLTGRQRTLQIPPRLCICQPHSNPAECLASVSVCVRKRRGQ